MANPTYSFETAASIAPARLFNAMIHDETLFPKAVPQVFKNIEIVQGDGGAGSVKLVTFNEGSRFSSAKHRVDLVDKDNLAYRYSVIDVEGGNMDASIEYVTYEFKVAASGDGGSIVKTTGEFHTKGDGQVSEEIIKGQKERGTGMIKAAVAYLEANPDAYN